jgi:hypothetical protein
MQSLVQVANLVTEPLQPGDAAIILKPNGEWRVATTGDLDPNGLTDAQVAQAETLMALMVALRYPQVMQVLKNLAADPNVVGEDPVEVTSRH